MKKFNQVLGEDEKLRVQLEMLISPTCSCKQAEICVVSCQLWPFLFLTLFQVFPGKSRSEEEATEEEAAIVTNRCLHFKVKLHFNFASTLFHPVN